MKSVRVIFDAFIFAVLGIILGFLIDMIFPEPNPNDTTARLIMLTLAQIVITIYITFVVDETYIELFGVDSDTFLGFTAFTIIFFLVQQQLLTRLKIVYNRLTGKDL